MSDKKDKKVIDEIFDAAFLFKKVPSTPCITDRQISGTIYTIGSGISLREYLNLKKEKEEKES